MFSNLLECSFHEVASDWSVLSYVRLMNLIGPTALIIAVRGMDAQVLTLSGDQLKRPEELFSKYHVRDIDKIVRKLE